MSTDDNSIMPPRSRKNSFDMDENYNEKSDGEENVRPRTSEMNRQLRRLSIEHTGRFMENWDPENSHRETRKLRRKIYSEGVRRYTVYDENGVFKKSNVDFCDCLEDDCPGCHFPCSKCNSPKCGHECRNNRKWTYDAIEVEGTDKVIRNKHK